MAVSGDAGPGTGRQRATRQATAVPTRSRANCVSRCGNFDMVENPNEWVADWVPFSTACPECGSFSNDSMCRSGVSTVNTDPGALQHGGRPAADPPLSHLPLCSARQSGPSCPPARGVPRRRKRGTPSSCRPREGPPRGRLPQGVNRPKAGRGGGDRLTDGRPTMVVAAQSWQLGQVGGAPRWVLV